MAIVTVNIDGKTYRMACDEGQEEHLTNLSRRLDRYIHHLKKSFGEIGDHRISVMAGIMVIDEMDELEKRLCTLEREIVTLERENQALQAVRKTIDVDPDYEKIVTEKFDAIAKRIMLLASRLSPENRYQYPLIKNSRSEQPDKTG